MRVRVDKIPDEGQQIRGNIDPSEIRLDVPVYRLIEPLAFVGQAIAFSVNS